MNLDKYQQAWKADGAQMNVTIDTESLANEVQHSQQTFQSTIFWRDVREAGASLLFIPIWLVLGSLMSLPWSWYLGVPAFIFIAGFILLDRMRHPQRASEPGEPILFYVKETLTQVEHQIWLLRNIFWWYLLPYGIPCVAFLLDVTWDSSSDWLEFVAEGGLMTLLLVGLYWGTYRMNQNAIRQHLEPRRQDLLKLMASLEGETADEDSGDIMELVSAVTTPVYNVGMSPGWERWADNWNSIIPSWYTVAAIALPTLGGALSGLASGLWLQIPEMGPTFFQTVIGAVIPFEIMFFGIWWWSSRKRKQKQLFATDDGQSSPDSSVASEGSASETPKRLPGAPAIAVLFLILFISAMAIAAIFSAKSHFGGDSRSRDVRRLSEPDFPGGSELSEAYLASIDAWLQAQVDLAKYPSLTAAIVRDGEIVYEGAFGFEEVKSGKKGDVANAISRRIRDKSIDRISARDAT